MFQDIFSNGIIRLYHISITYKELVEKLIDRDGRNMYNNFVIYWRGVRVVEGA